MTRAMSAAERQRRRRERLRAGKIRLVVMADEIKLIDRLTAGGFLRPQDADDPAKIAAALSTAVEQWIAAPPDPDSRHA